MAKKKIGIEVFVDSKSHTRPDGQGYRCEVCGCEATCMFANFFNKDVNYYTCKDCCPVCDGKCPMCGN